ncbi:unnamed protein product [Amoebophrya sp. A120]|nr:unnamed protein product [Amoebophrya sp. A120]|eukprot:GSA120T00019853001.1
MLPLGEENCRGALVLLVCRLCPSPAGVLVSGRQDSAGKSKRPGFWKSRTKSKEACPSLRKVGGSVPSRRRCRPMRHAPARPAHADRKKPGRPFAGGGPGRRLRRWRRGSVWSPPGERRRAILPAGRALLGPAGWQALRSPLPRARKPRAPRFAWRSGPVLACAAPLVIGPAIWGCGVPRRHDFCPRLRLPGRDLFGVSFPPTDHALVDDFRCG